MPDLFGNWFKGLDKTRRAAFSQLATILGTNEIDDVLWEDLEAILIQADLGVETSERILNHLLRDRKSVV